MRRLYILFFFLMGLICTINGNAQSRAVQMQKIVDSIQHSLIGLGEDTNKVKRLADLGFWLWRQKKYSDAVNNENYSLKLAVELNYKPGILKAHVNLSNIAIEQHHYQEALDHESTVLKLEEEFGNIKGIGSSYNEIAGIFLSQSKYKEALDADLKAAKYWEEAHHDDGLPIVYNNIGNLYESMGEHEQALLYTSKALKLWGNTTDNFNKMFVCGFYTQIGNIYQNQGKYPEAMRNFLASLKTAEQIPHLGYIIDGYTNVGVLYSAESNYSEALKSFLMSLEYAKKLGNKTKLADAFNNIGMTYSKQNNFDQAIEAYLSSLRLREETKDTFNTIGTYCNLGEAYGELGLFDKGLKNVFKGLEVAKQFDDKPGLTMCYNTLSSLYMKIGTHLITDKTKKDSVFNTLSLSRQFQLDALQIAEQTNNLPQLADGYIQIGKVLGKQLSLVSLSQRKAKSKAAIAYLRDGISIAKNIGNKDLLKQAYSNLSDIYQAINDYQKGLKYQKLYSDEKDSILNLETTAKISDLMVQYESEKAEALEKTRQQDLQSEMKLRFAKKEDSLNYQQGLMQEQLKRQTLLAIQRQQEVQLQKVSLNMIDQQKEIVQLRLLKSQSDLLAEQSQRKGKERQLMIADKENALRSKQVELQKTQLSLKESQLNSERRQRYYYMGGIGLLILAVFFIIRDFKNRHRANAALASQKLKTEKAEAIHKMAELELQSLRAQLNPHFMFNSLNAIQELVLMEDNERSHIYLSAFADLLRLLLDNANQPFIPLKKELDFLHLYLSLENLRIPNLQYFINVAEGIDIQEANIPNMILQPYIENSIWHGLSAKEGDRKLSIDVRQTDNNLIFHIQDNGVGRKRAAELKTLYRKQYRSKGMELLSKRFSLLSREYATNIETKIIDLYTDERPCGTLVEIVVPLTFSQYFKEASYDTNRYN